jgi:hypothetical protein
MFLKIAYEYSLRLEKSNEPKYIVLNGIGLAATEAILIHEYTSVNNVQRSCLVSR